MVASQSFSKRLSIREICNKRTEMHTTPWQSSAAVSTREWSAQWFALAFPALLTWVYFVILADHPAHVQQISYTIGKTFQFLFPLFWTIWICRERLRPTLFRTTGWRHGFLFGIAGVLAMIALYHQLLVPSGLSAVAGAAIRLKLGGFGIATLPQYIVMSIFYSLLHSLLEEYYWRWFVFGRLRQVVSVRNAAIIASLGFCAHHVIVLGIYFGFRSPTTWLFSLAVAIGGAFWCWLYHRNNALFAPWLSHALIDGGIFLLGYQMVGGLG